MIQMKKLKQTWRWYGPSDPVSLQDVRQAGATGIVTALHHIPHGDVWPIEDIIARKSLIQQAGLQWDVVESVPVHEVIKTGIGDVDHYIDHYKQTLRNLASAGIKTICYNFMPVLDWTRTQLDLEMPNGAKALYFDWSYLAVFDIYLLNRTDARNDYPEAVLQQADRLVKELSPAARSRLSEVILMGIPNEKAISLDDLSGSIAIYKEIGREGLRNNLVYFLSSIAEVCEETGVKLTIHPDDPPYSILGLPRIASSKEDLQYILGAVDKPFNGICFCTGSLGAGAQNDVKEILEAVSSRVYFAHLRNVKKDGQGSFYEADHLDGDVNMYEVMELLVAENQRREHPIPFRPDHGHQMLDDLHKTTNPGYSAIGRLRGLAELRGLEVGLLGGKHSN